MITISGLNHGNILVIFVNDLKYLEMLNGPISVLPIW